MWISSWGINNRIHIWFIHWKTCSLKHERFVLLKHVHLEGICRKLKNLLIPWPGMLRLMDNSKFTVNVSTNGCYKLQTLPGYRFPFVRPLTAGIGLQHPTIYNQTKSDEVSACLFLVSEMSFYFFPPGALRHGDLRSRPLNQPMSSRSVSFSVSYKLTFIHISLCFSNL